MNFEVTRCVLIASPGFVRDHFFEYMMQWASKSVNAESRVLLENKSKFLLVHASSGFKHSLQGRHKLCFSRSMMQNSTLCTEVLADPALTARMADTKAMAEVKALETFYTTFNNEPNRAFYGFKHVEKASQAQAIDTLLISDNLFRFVSSLFHASNGCAITLENLMQVSER